VLCLAISLRAAEPAKPKKPKPAVLQVSGYGPLGNRVLKRTLRTVELGGGKPEYFGGTFVEDSALILTARVKRDGFLKPTITIRLKLADGAEMQMTASDLLENPLPRQLRVVKARFHIEKGVLYYYQDLEFSRLKSIPEKQARSYFLETEALFHLKRARIYTPERLKHGISSLTDILDQQGYQNAKAEAKELQLDDKSGAVRVRVDVEEGPKFLVRSVREQLLSEGASQPELLRTIHPDRPYSKLWVQDFSLGLKTNEFQRGYPDASVDIKTLKQEQQQDRILVDLQATVKSGSQVRISGVEFQGYKKTKPWLLKRRVRIQRGELLDPIRVENGRYRLARLGVFDTVGLDYRNVDEHDRSVIYRLKEAKTLNVSLLFGWGSYELLRGGVEATLNNLWGLAHHAEFTAIQSFKSSSGNFLYTVPELIGKDVDLFFNGSALRRIEVDFTRLEYGGGAGLHKYFQSTATDVSGRYNYQILSAQEFSNFQEVASEGLTNPAVGSVIFEIKHDRRDNPLYPHRGYKIFATVETAGRVIGGDANYERVEISSSWHHSFGGGRYISLGLSHGVDVSFGSPANNLPFNKRFFPGGANSIRGYQEGEASPYNSFDQIVGAETYTLGSVELEQALTPSWSIVLFSDSLGYAHSIDNYPFDAGLYSVGVGLRWRTIIGPIRLEYGHNLNPRPQDPSGTLQFSLGFPF
jgi:outer membrane protein assembly complex protein YaeT